MTVQELYDALAKVEDKTIPVIFTYDSRAGGHNVTVVEHVIESKYENNIVAIRGEQEDEYDCLNPHGTPLDQLRAKTISDLKRIAEDDPTSTYWVEQAARAEEIADNNIQWVTENRNAIKKVVVLHTNFKDFD
jgi:hypothetical protein